MMKNLLVVVFLLLAGATFAQSEAHEAFKKDEELKAAFLKLDMTTFVGEPVNFICDTLEKTVRGANNLNTLLKTYVVFPKNTHVQKASETNNGYVQNFGIYNKTDDALMYVRFTINPLTGKLEEVMVEKNN